MRSINDLLAGVDCACGRRHSCAVEKVCIQPEALRRLPALCAGERRILLVADENTYAAAGEKTEENLRGKDLRRLIFSGKSVLIPDESAVERLTEASAEAELIIGVGSGVIQDLCKYVSSRRKIPYLVVATAPSMDGYASTGAAMILDGMKVTVPAGVPRAILAEPEILKNAPMEMIRAGYGDIVGKYSALNDWKLSHLINGEYFCDFIYDLTVDAVEKTLKLGEGLLRRSEESLCALMEALVTVGIAMSFAGSSRPASGSEHHLSHFFEISGIVNGESSFPHGIDVAYSAVITQELREIILRREFASRLYRPDRGEYVKKMEQIYKSVGAGCVQLQDQVGNYAKDPMEIYREKEAQIRRVLSQAPDSRTIRRLIGLVGLDMEDFYQMYGEEKIKTAVLYAKDLKDRYTVLWLHYDMYGGEK